MRPTYPFRIIQRSAAGGDWTTDATSLLTQPEGRRPWIRDRRPPGRRCGCSGRSSSASTRARAGGIRRPEAIRAAARLWCERVLWGYMAAGALPALGVLWVLFTLAQRFME